MDTIGERLLVARKAARLSLRELAERAGVSHTAINKYERGLDIPSSGVLLALADALDRRVDFFLKSRELELTCVEFRKRARMGERDKGAVLAAVAEGCERYLEIEEFFPDDMPAFPEVRSASRLSEVEQIALDVRAEWNLGLDPIESMVDVLEDNGVFVMQISGPTSFDAFTCRVNGAIPVVAVKHGIPGDRQRLNLAHELGHLLVKVTEGLDEEAAAYRFAAAFLVPAEVAVRELGEKRSALEIPDELGLLKEKYGISMQAWIVRARDLGIISPEKAAEYFRLFRMRHWHREEPGPAYPQEEPRRLKQLVLRALAEQMLTESRASELLGMRVRTLSMPEDGAAA